MLDVDDVAADLEVGEEHLAVRRARPDGALAFDQPKISWSVRGSAGRLARGRVGLGSEREPLGERARDEDERCPAAGASATSATTSPA